MKEFLEKVSLYSLWGIFVCIFMGFVVVATTGNDDAAQGFFIAAIVCIVVLGVSELLEMTLS